MKTLVITQTDGGGHVLPEDDVAIFSNMIRDAPRETLEAIFEKILATLDCQYTNAQVLK